MSGLKEALFMAFPLSFPIQFDNPFGWYAFSGIAALVLMYMIRPKMIDVKIPSLMFLMKQKGTREKSTFLKKFTTNVLFFLQFLLISLLAAAAVSPLITTTYDSTAENTVLVLDVSASMHTQEASGTRFDHAIKMAEKYVRGTTSIVLAESVPLIVLDKGSESKAREILSHLKPKETGTNIGDSMILANDLIGGTGQSQLDGRVIVISDFIWTEGADPEIVKTLLESRGLVVDFINIAEDKQDKQQGQGSRGNIGFVDLSLGTLETAVSVKNYFDTDKDIIIEVTNEDSPPQRFPKKLLPHSLETVAFKTLGGVTIAHLKDSRGNAIAGDVVEADNVLFISNPKKGGIKVLILSNKPNKFLKTALEASGDVVVTESEPPIIPHITPEAYDIVIFNNIDPGKLLSGTVDELRAFVSSGKSLVVTYQESINALKLGDLLPVTIKETYGETAVSVTVENQFTKDVEFGSVKQHYRAEADNATIVLATGVTSGSPIIALKGYSSEKRPGSGAAAKGGKLVYYGIDDFESDFKNAPSYPIFWNGILNFMVGVESLSNFNHKTGKVFAFDREIPIDTPYNTILTSKLVMDNAGIYIITGMNHAANLIDEKESDVYQSASFTTTKAETYAPKKILKEKQVSLEFYLLVGALAFFLLELLYSKYRGDF